MGCVRAPRREIYLSVSAFRNEGAGRKRARQAEGIQVPMGLSWYRSCYVEVGKTTIEA